MAKQYVVARGQIEDGKKVLARRGERYTPSNKVEADRLVSRGVIVEVNPAKATASKASTGDGDSGTATGGETGGAAAGAAGDGEGTGA